MTERPIPPYTEADERAAREAVEQWRDRPIRSRVGTHELDDLVREVAGAIATARTEGVEAALAVAAREHDAAEAIRRELLGSAE